MSIKDVASSTKSFVSTDIFRLVITVLFYLMAIALTLFNVIYTQTGSSDISWSYFHVGAPGGYQWCYSDSAYWYVGLTNTRVNWSGGCTATGSNSDLFSSSNFGYGTACVTVGKGIIAGMTFALFFSIATLILIFLTCFKIPYPRLMISVSMMCSLACYVAVPWAWLSQCQTLLNGGTVQYDPTHTYSNAGVTAGWATGVAFFSLFLVVVAIVFQLWRQFSPRSTSDTATAGQAVFTRTGMPASPTTSSSSWNGPISPPNAGSTAYVAEPSYSAKPMPGGYAYA